MVYGRQEGEHVPQSSLKPKAWQVLGLG